MLAYFERLPGVMSRSCRGASAETTILESSREAVGGRGSWLGAGDEVRELAESLIDNHHPAILTHHSSFALLHPRAVQSHLTTLAYDYYCITDSAPPPPHEIAIRRLP
jgi:hypothetical protein